MAFVCSFTFVAGCKSEIEKPPPANTETTTSSTETPVQEESGEPDWQLVDSNEWYDLFELARSENESVFCTAFHKTDAQLGIGIAFNIAVRADDRNYKYFTFNDASLTQKQKNSLEPHLPEARVLESYFLVSYLNAKPDAPQSHVFDAEFMAQMRRDQPADFD